LLEHFVPNYERTYTFGSAERGTNWLNMLETSGAKKCLRGYVDPVKMPVIEQFRYLTGLDDVQLAILKYDTGYSLPLHVDHIPGSDHTERDGIKIGKNMDPGVNPNYTRLIVALQDRMPGQFMQQRNFMINSWKAGDVWQYQAVTDLHSAGNAGPHTRYSLRITGKPTTAFEKFCKKELHHVS
jgi:hypothetical protein